MGQWTNSNNRRTVTDGSFAIQIYQGCMVDHKKKNAYWPASIAEMVQILELHRCVTDLLILLTGILSKWVSMLIYSLIELCLYFGTWYGLPLPKVELRLTS